MTRTSTPRESDAHWWCDEDELRATAPRLLLGERHCRLSRKQASVVLRSAHEVPTSCDLCFVATLLSSPLAFLPAA